MSHRGSRLAADAAAGDGCDRGLSPQSAAHSGRGANRGMAFLQWLVDNHFTFLGARDYKFAGSAERRTRAGAEQRSRHSAQARDAGVGSAAARW